ncbi:beta-lactamase domain protein [Enhygromyxa salina]|uniref:Beta-lactamase domain protein n=1 Tax=Enhygromyxa salina TaxID=215803 RepID=A0A0C1Z915_9BACT|nr:MBL fold metallo-hydrolase [Enhygromyxa salina]KIG14099.1 beta-lactamase domain protein [Enhygromyxa salina]
MNELVFVGTGEALDPALPNTSLLVRGPRTLLLDCGYAVPHAFWQISQDVNLLDAVWISHGHADHCFGLPALLLWMRLGGRTRELTILGGPGSRGRIGIILELGYPGSYAASKCYPLSFVELEPGAVGEFGPMSLRIAASAHSIVNHALRVDTPGLRSVMYSGDGAITPGTRALATGVDVLVHECFFAAPGGQRKHGDVEGCMALAREARVQTLSLLHFAAEAKAEIRQRVAELDDRAFEVLMPAVGDRVGLDL